MTDVTCQSPITQRLYSKFAFTTYYVTSKLFCGSQ